MLNRPQITIDKDIPLVRECAKYPFHKMDVGDSFLFPPGISRSAASSAAHHYGKYHTKKFSTAATPDGIRCWRIA